MWTILEGLPKNINVILTLLNFIFFVFVLYLVTCEGNCLFNRWKERILRKEYEKGLQIGIDLGKKILLEGIKNDSLYFREDYPTHRLLNNIGEKPIDEVVRQWFIDRNHKS
jgi:hypothetical protein